MCKIHKHSMDKINLIHEYHHVFVAMEGEGRGGERGRRGRGGGRGGKKRGERHSPAGRRADRCRGESSRTRSVCGEISLLPLPAITPTTLPIFPGSLPTRSLVSAPVTLFPPSYFRRFPLWVRTGRRRARGSAHAPTERSEGTKGVWRRAREI